MYYLCNRITNKTYRSKKGVRYQTIIINNTILTNLSMRYIHKLDHLLLQYN